MKQPAETVRTRVSVDIKRTLHEDMHEIAKRRRVHIGNVYDEAIKLFLLRPENYLGKRETDNKPKFQFK